MKGSEIRVGGVYLAKVSGSIHPVRVDAEDEAALSGRRIWRCTNLATGRSIVVKSAQRFRGPAPARDRYASDPETALTRAHQRGETPETREADHGESGPDYGGAFDGTTVTSDADPGL